MATKEESEYQLEKEIREGNKAIEIFRGNRIEGDTVILKITGSRIHISECHFHSSWSWLMPVVIKIAELKHPVNIYISHIQKAVYIYSMKSDHYLVRVADARHTPIQNTWLAVVEFLKNYNTQKL